MACARKGLATLIVAATASAAVAISALPAAASSPGLADGGVIANAVPAKYTPNFGDGAVMALVQVGQRMVAGGSFTTVSQVTSAGTAAATSRKYLMAFNPTTGALDAGFVPSVDGEVDAVVPTADGTGVYVAGQFTTAGGVSTRLALFNLSNGQRVAAFNPSVNGPINDMALVGGHLLLAGTFTSVRGQVRNGLASVNAANGAVESYLAIQLSGHHNYGRVAGAASARVGATSIAVSPDHTRAIVDGNFTNAADTVNTAGYARDQIVSINLAGAATVDPNWNTNAYTNACYSWAYDSFVRDIGWAPDGSYFVVVATGGYHGGSMEDCDSASRFDASATGPTVQPAWVQYTGTDSLYSVAVTSSAVYVGGHQRWLNNPYGQDSPGPGAVPRAGLAALDPATGVPLSWNPGRLRGHGAEVVYATAAGVWVGSDTDYVGNYAYKHQKIAFFPFAGGKPAVTDNAGNPGTVFLAGSRPTSSNTNVLYRVHAAGAAIQSTDNGPDWAADTASAPSPLHNSGSNASGWSPITNVSASFPAYAPKALFTSERWDPGTKNDGQEMVWTLPVPAANSGDNLTVNLFFANRCSCTSAAGQRQFDVKINGQQVLSNYDIVADVGDQTGTMKSFTVPAATGNVTVEFDHEVENPLVNGIEVVDASKAAPPAGALDTFSANSFNPANGAGAAAATQPQSGGINWGSVRGAFMLNGRIWYGSADGNFYYRTYNGANTFGPAMLVDPYNDPYWSNVKTGSGTTVFRGTPSSFYAEIPNVTGMFYANRSIYYTLNGDGRLYRRSFSPDTATSSVASQVTGGIISPVEVVVSDPASGPSVPDFTDAGGMFLANGSLWYSKRSDGHLYQATWNGATVTSNGVLDANANGTNWSARGVFVAPS